MNISNSTFRVISAATVTLLAGCNGIVSQPQLTRTPAVATSNALAPVARPYYASPWMAPEAKSQDLAYISDFSGDTVYVFSYRKHTLMGSLTGFDGPDGECVDTAGDVFIVNTNGGNILEYAHGGTSPIATLNDPYGVGASCAVNPLTGDLAVTNQTGAGSSGPGNLLIYKNAQGTPKRYSDSGLYAYFFCGYDDKGHLFVDGQSSLDGPFHLAELPNLHKKFKDITLSQTIYFGGAIQWDGKYLAIGDQLAGGKVASAIYRFAINGTNGVLKGALALRDAGDVAQFWKHGQDVIGADYVFNHVLWWHYPAGGGPITILNGFGSKYPIGATVSPGKQP